MKHLDQLRIVAALLLQIDHHVPQDSTAQRRILLVDSQQVRVLPELVRADARTLVGEGHYRMLHVQNLVTGWHHNWT